MPVIIRTTIPQITVAVKQALSEVVKETAEQVVVNIEGETKRPHHGHIYPSRRERDVLHTASAPGESFATDTESLIAGMSTEHFGLTSWIDFGDELGAYRWSEFEFGGRIAPRPTIVPIMSHMEDQFAQDLASAAIQAATENELK